MDFEVSGSPAVSLGQAIQSTPTRLGTHSGCGGMWCSCVAMRLQDLPLSFMS